MAGILYTFYIDVIFEDGARKRHKANAGNGSNAMNAIRRDLEKRKDIKAMVVRSKHPKTKHNRAKEANYKRAQRERRKKEREDRISVYTGEKAMSLSEHNARVKAMQDAKETDN
jgi:hypothetical protein